MKSKSIELLGKTIKLIIFDMDGTLVDSIGIWDEIDRNFFLKRGFDCVPPEYQEMIIHTGLEKGAEMTIKNYGLVNDTVEGIVKEWRDASIDQYANKIPLKEYAKEILDKFKESDVILALATANNEKLYMPCLKRLGIDKYFDLIVDVDMVNEGKSSSKIYDYICSHFNCKPRETIVFEDSLMGLTTAFNAGYVTVGVDDKSSRKVEKEKKEKSYKYIYSFKEFFTEFKA